LSPLPVDRSAKLDELGPTKPTDRLNWIKPKRRDCPPRRRRTDSETLPNAVHRRRQRLVGMQVLLLGQRLDDAVGVGDGQKTQVVQVHLVVLRPSLGSRIIGRRVSIRENSAGSSTDFAGMPVVGQTIN
jgi:hypothetical protein